MGRQRAAQSIRASVGRAYRDLPLFWKILFPFVLLMLVVALSGATFVVRHLASRAEEGLERDLFDRAVTVRAGLLDAEFSLLESVRFAANLRGLPAALADGDSGGVASLLTSVAAVKERVDLLVVTDRAGTGVVELYRSEEGRTVQSGRSWSEAPFMARLLGEPADAVGEKEAGLLEVEGTPYLVVAGPVLREGAPVGTILAGARLEGVVDELAARASAGVAVRGADRALGARSADFRGAQSPLATPPGEDETVRVTEELDGVSTSTLHTSLELRDRPAGTISIQVPTDPALAPVQDAGLRLALLLAVALVAMVGVGILLSRSITRRLQSLLETNRALGSGKLSARAEVSGSDELGELAEGLNQMAEELEASHDELETRVAERTDEIRRLYDDLKEATQRHSELLAGITHDFRTPLFAILGHASMMRDPNFVPDDPSWRAEFAETIHSSGEYLMQLVDDLLGYEELESGRVEIAPAPCDLGRLLAGLEGTVVPLARAADLEASIDVPRDLPFVEADESRLKQVILNLVSNGIKYTPPGGVVEVTAAARRQRVEVSVSDTGIGIPKKAGARIFEPFYRVPGSRPQQEQSSSGLGLAITKRLVEAHGGRIRYVSGSEGTTFTFSLPVASRRLVAVGGDRRAG